MELIHCKAQCSCEEECIPKCMLYFVFLKKLNTLNLSTGRVVTHYPNTPQFTGVPQCYCNLYIYL